MKYFSLKYLVPMGTRREEIVRARNKSDAKTLARAYLITQCQSKLKLDTIEEIEVING